MLRIKPRRTPVFALIALLLLQAVGAPRLLAAPTRLGKADQHAQTAYKDEATTWTNTVTISGGSLSTTVNSLAVTGTLANPGSLSNEVGVLIGITPGGTTNTSFQKAASISLNAGTFTGARETHGLYTRNRAAGTTSLVFGTGGVGNIAVEGLADATTTGMNYGLIGNGRNGNTNAGVYGYATTAKNSAKNVGVAGYGYNTGTSPVHIGGLFALTDSNSITLASAALLVDNVATTDPIAIFRDNGTTVFSIQDGGSANFQKIASTNFVFENQTSDPGSPVEGQVYWNPTTNVLKIYDGATFSAIGGSGVITGTLTSSRVPFASGTNTLTDSANMTFVTDTLTVTNVTATSNLTGANLLVSGTGSAATPDIADSANPDTGYFWSTGASVLGMSVEGTEVVGIGSTADHRVTITGGTLTTLKSALSITATHAAGTATENGASLTTTTNATGATGNKRGLAVTLDGGYVGSGATTGIRSDNSVLGTGATLVSGAGNYGLFGRANGAGAGYNIGVGGNANQGTTLNVGVTGNSVANYATGRSVGGVFTARNNTSNLHTALVASLHGSDPTFTNAAFIANNSDVAAPIVLFQDNATEVFSIQDGGQEVSSTNSGSLWRNGNATPVEGARRYCVNVTTTNGTQTEIPIDGSTFLPALASGDVWGGTSYLTAKCTVGTDANKMAVFKIDYAIRNIGGTTTLVNVVVTTIANESTSGAWAVTAVADDTNDRLAIKVTGAASTTIKWAGWVEATKVN